MRTLVSPALKARLALLTALLMLSVPVLACAGLAAGLDWDLARLHPELGLGWSVAPLYALLFALAWSAVWFLRLRRELGLLGRRPVAVAEGLPQAARHALLAAEDAFDQGDFGDAAGFLERTPEADRPPGAWILLGRSLALDGDVERAAPALERGGEGRAVLRLLSVRAPVGRREPLLKSLPRRLGRLPGMALLFAALAAPVPWAWGVLRGEASALRAVPSFDETAFHEEAEGRFTFFYHDPAFLGRAAPLAEDALDSDLAFLGLGPAAFAPGEIRVYLCDNEAEYRRRAPSHPSWESACADPPRASVYLYPLGRDGDGGAGVDFEIVLGHELGHLCYYRLAGTAPDDWLNEGLADYLGFTFALDREGIPRQAWLQERYFKGLPSKALPFGRFFRVDPHDLPPSEVGTFYLQGFSVVYLLVEDYGREPFLAFLKAFGRTKDLDRALAAAYPTIPDVAALAAVWGLFYPPGR